MEVEEPICFRLELSQALKNPPVISFRPFCSIEPSIPHAEALAIQESLSVPLIGHIALPADFVQATIPDDADARRYLLRSIHHNLDLSAYRRKSVGYRRRRLRSRLLFGNRYAHARATLHRFSEFKYVASESESESPSVPTRKELRKAHFAAASALAHLEQHGMASVHQEIAISLMISPKKQDEGDDDNDDEATRKKKTQKRAGRSNSLAVHYFRNDQFQKAVVQSLRTLTLDPSNAYGWSSLGASVLALQLLQTPDPSQRRVAVVEDALELLQKGTALMGSPPDSWDLSVQGRVNLMLGREVRALGLACACFRTVRDNTVCWNFSRENFRRLMSFPFDRVVEEVLGRRYWGLTDAVLLHQVHLLRETPRREEMADRVVEEKNRKNPDWDGEVLGWTFLDIVKMMDLDLHPPKEKIEEGEGEAEEGGGGGGNGNGNANVGNADADGDDGAGAGNANANVDDADQDAAAAVPVPVPQQQQGAEAEEGQDDDAAAVVADDFVPVPVAVVPPVAAPAPAAAAADDNIDAEQQQQQQTPPPVVPAPAVPAPPSIIPPVPPPPRKNRSHFIESWWRSGRGCGGCGGRTAATSPPSPFSSLTTDDARYVGALLWDMVVLGGRVDEDEEEKDDTESSDDESKLKKGSGRNYRGDFRDVVRRFEILPMRLRMLRERKVADVVVECRV